MKFDTHSLAWHKNLPSNVFARFLIMTHIHKRITIKMANLQVDKTMQNKATNR
jgi:hypothetical protein